MFTYAGTEVIRPEHHAVMVEPNRGSESTEFLTHRLERFTNKYTEENPNFIFNL